MTKEWFDKLIMAFKSEWERASTPEEPITQIPRGQAVLFCLEDVLFEWQFNEMMKDVLKFKCQYTELGSLTSGDNKRMYLAIFS